MSVLTLAGDFEFLGQNAAIRSRTPLDFSILSRSMLCLAVGKAEISRRDARRSFSTNSNPNAPLVQSSQYCNITTSASVHGALSSAVWYD